MCERYLQSSSEMTGKIRSGLLADASVQRKDLSPDRGFMLIGETLSRSNSDRTINIFVTIFPAGKSRYRFV